MKQLAMLGVLVVAFSAPPVHAEFDVKRCMRKCVKLEKEKREDKDKEDRGDKEDSKGKDQKVNLQEVKQVCESICVSD